MKIVIVGGGIAGLSLARELALRGIRSTVLERAPQLNPVGAGIIMNPNAMRMLEKNGLVFSGMSPDGRLPEIIERPDHPWFVGVQFHPELKSKPFDPHPLFAGFIAAALRQSRLV